MDAVDGLTLHPDVLAYIVTIVRATREHPLLELGASPRTGVKLSRLVRALSLLRGQDYVDLDTVKEIIIPAMAHRVNCRDPQGSATEVLTDIVKSTAVDPSYKDIVKRASRAGRDSPRQP